MSKKYGLIIGNTEYSDPGLAQLSAPGKDAEDFARVLKDQEIGAFDNVNVLVNHPSSTIIEAIDEFFDQKNPDDLLVLYFSGHGIKDDLGTLYLAVKNTNRSRLRSTAIKSDYIRETMDQSRSKRQVLILDCCMSGAFAPGTKAATGVTIGTASAFEGGYGRIILTASDSTQFAWEGDQIIGETNNSLFTNYLVKGLEGEADHDSDGRITVDELYDYAYEKVRLATPKQTPSKFSSKQQGEIILRISTRIENIKPLPLPAELVDEIEDSRPYVREAAVQKLEKILKGKNIGLARSAKEILEKIANEDDSRRVSQAATQVLNTIRQIEQKAEEERKAKEEVERLAIIKAEQEQLEREKAAAERKSQEEAEKLARAKAEREAAELEANRLKSEREAAELAAREATEKVTKEKIEKETSEREVAWKAEKEAIELAARRKAEREAAEKAEREAQKLATQKKLEREVIEKSKINQETPHRGVFSNFIYKIKTAEKTKWDTLYWYVSLLGIAGILIPIYRGILSDNTQNTDVAFYVGIEWRNFFMVKLHSLRGYTFFILYCSSVIFQSWLLAKYKSILGFIWATTTLFLPVGLAIYMIYLYNQLVYLYSQTPTKKINSPSEILLPFLGQYIGFLLVLWVLLVPLFTIWSYRKHQKNHANRI